MAGLFRVLRRPLGHAVPSGDRLRPPGPFCAIWGPSAPSGRSSAGLGPSAPSGPCCALWAMLCASVPLCASVRLRASLCASLGVSVPLWASLWALPMVESAFSACPKSQIFAAPSLLFGESRFSMIHAIFPNLPQICLGRPSRFPENERSERLPPLWGRLEPVLDMAACGLMRRTSAACGAKFSAFFRASPRSPSRIHENRSPVVGAAGVNCQRPGSSALAARRL